MGKKLPNTPRSRVRAALRALWLRSRERAAALKAAGNCCEECGIKQSRAKGKEVYIEVHHREHILNWELLFDYIYRHLLCDPSALQVLCIDCHDKLHKEESDVARKESISHP